MTPRPGGPETGPGRLGSAVVIGTGLIGTSIALALCERGVTVWLTDHDPAAARLAADLGAGKVLPEPLGAAERGRGSPEAAPSPGRRPQAQDGPWADLAVLAVPPAAVAPSLAAAQARRLARWYTDVASVKALPLRAGQRARLRPGQLRARPPAVRPGAVGPGRRPGRSVPRPPMGDLPRAVDPARGDRGRRRPGALLPRRAGPGRCGRARPLGGAGLARAACGGRGHGGPAEPTRPAARWAWPGQGLRDVTRIAAGDTGLWTQILAANAAPVARVLADVAADLPRVAALASPARRRTPASTRR